MPSVIAQDLVVHIGEGEARRLYAREAAPSMYLGREDRDALLAQAAHRSKRGLDDLIAELAPRPDVPTLVRRAPQPRPRAEGVLSEASTATSALAVQLCPGRVEARAGTNAPHDPSAPPTPPVVAPALPARPGSIQALAPARYRVQFTASKKRAWRRSGAGDRVSEQRAAYGP